MQRFGGASVRGPGQLHRAGGFSGRAAIRSQVRASAAFTVPRSASTRSHPPRRLSASGRRQAFPRGSARPGLSKPPLSVIEVSVEHRVKIALRQAVMERKRLPSGDRSRRE